MANEVTLLIKYRDRNVAELYSQARPNLDGDAGFDLYLPEDVTIGKGGKVVPLGIQTAMIHNANAQSEFEIYVLRSIFYIKLALLGIVTLINQGLGLLIAMSAMLVMAVQFWIAIKNGDYPSPKPKKKYVSYRIYPRSSIFNTQVRLANSVGVVDSGYRGEIMAAFDNISDHECTIPRGTKLVQLVYDAGEITAVKSVNSFEATVRGARGFGSTS